MGILNTIKNFIVIEGLDGSGTTTQLNMINNKFVKNGIKSLSTMEPTGSDIGALIRKALKKDIAIKPETLALLFAADRNEHLYGKDGIINYIEKGYFVISDRYLFSSIAYQSLDCDREWVAELNNFPLPEMLFFIDVPPYLCQDRMKNRSSKELFEEISIQEKILENYSYGIKSLSESGMKVFNIDGTLTPDLINEKMWEIINQCR